MNVLQRRRQFFGKGVAYITFHGNGGQTATGDITVIIPIPKGTMWTHVAKPKFTQPGTAKQQNGFTTVQGDDNTFIGSDYIVTSDMVVYASYTAIEIGIITHGGEVMSVGGWINKYGSTLWNVIGIGGTVEFIGDSNNLVQFMYAKISEKEAFALSAKCVFPDGSRLDYIGGTNKPLGGNGIYVNINSWDSRILVSNGVGITYPMLHNPPVWDKNDPQATMDIPQAIIDEIMSISSGKADTYKFLSELAGQTDVYGITGSPVAEYIATWSVGTAIAPGSFYIASPYQVDLLYKNRDIFLGILDELEAWSNSIYPRPVPLYYAYGSHDGPINAHGFYDLRYKLEVGDTIHCIQQAIGGTYDYDTHLPTYTVYAVIGYDGFERKIIIPGTYGVGFTDRYSAGQFCYVSDVSHLF